MNKLHPCPVCLDGNGKMVQKLEYGGSIMEILNAYCVELKEIVNIFRAHKEYFAQPENKRLRFEFRCSNSECRAAKNPLVVGVNYDKKAEDSVKFMRQHFKTHPKASAHPKLRVDVRHAVETVGIQ